MAGAYERIKIEMKYLILGAGPAGLAFANQLKQKGEDSFLVLEKEMEAGGLCRSAEVDSAPLDIGGGHFLDVKRPKVNAFLFHFMPEEEWNLFTRDSRIIVNGNEVNHPIEANIWQMKDTDQEAYLQSIEAAGCNQEKDMPKEFVDWIYWKLGDKIARDYMIPYNQKMFGPELNELGTYWLDKLPNVSYDETRRSCLTKTAYGTQPGHAQFYYPKKYGYGELWHRMADAVNEHMVYGVTVKELNFNSHTVTAADGTEYGADIIVTTIPWAEYRRFYGMPEGLQAKIKNLKHSAVETRYYEETLDTKAQWVYYPDPSLAYHRILVRSNFCPHSKGYWTETNCQRLNRIPAEEQKNFHNRNPYAYPLNTKEKPAIMKELLAWARQHQVYGLGRWGEHEHFNSDVTVERAMALAADVCTVKHEKRAICGER